MLNKGMFKCTKTWPVVVSSMISTTLLFATIIRVPSQYPTIQQGLNAAQVGDTVLVAAGTYTENITWPSVDGINLLSEDGSKTTIIDGNSAGRVINFPSYSYSQNTKVNGFAIKNGNSPRGSGLYLNGSPHIVNNIIERNVIIDTSGWLYGSGIFCNGSGAPLIEANMIRGNVIQGPDWNFGAGIYVDRLNTALIIGNTIEHDSAVGGSWNYGVGIYCDGESQPDIRHNIIQHNVAFQGSRGHGVGIYTDDNCNGYILSNLIYQNTARTDNWNYGAGILVNSGAQVYNNTIVENSCVGGYWAYGGGIYIYDSTNTIGNNIIVNNTAGTGGGIYCSSLGHATLLNNDVWNNTGGNYSGISPGANDISQDPLFVTGPLGDYYLSQVAAGQGQNSPCLDYGFASAQSLELDTFTTRTDSVFDQGIVDLGYHYPLDPYVSIDDFDERHRMETQIIGFTVSPTFSSSSFKIRLSLPSTQKVELTLIDRTGRNQKNIIKGMLPAGSHDFRWNGKDLASGVYFFVVKTTNQGVYTEKVVFVNP